MGSTNKACKWKLNFFCCQNHENCPFAGLIIIGFCNKKCVDKFRKKNYAVNSDLFSENDSKRKSDPKVETQVNGLLPAQVCLYNLY